MTLMLFIGGVADGDWKGVPEWGGNLPKVWAVPKPVNHPVATPYTANIALDATIERDDYLLECIAFPDGIRIEYYRCEKLTPVQAIRRLFDWYSPGSDLPTAKNEIR